MSKHTKNLVGPSARDSSNKPNKGTASSGGTKLAVTKRTILQPDYWRNVNTGKSNLWLPSRHIFGLDISCEPWTGGATELACRLLWFVLRGLSTADVIPLGYFFTGNRKHDRLRNLNFSVLNCVRGRVLHYPYCHRQPPDKQRHVSRHVGWQHTTTSACFATSSAAKWPIVPFIWPNHLIKNLRTNFLERERGMFDGMQKVRDCFVLKALFKIQ